MSFLKNKAGFTMVELLISMTIMIALAGVTIASLDDTPPKFDLENSAQRITSDLRKAEGFSLSAREFGTSTPEGWGLHIDLSNDRTYQLFADLDCDESDTCGNPHNSEYRGNLNYEASEEKAEQTTLPGSVSIDSLTYKGSSISSINIVYFPPHPKIWINDGSVKEVISGKVKIQIRSEILGDTRTISINKVGGVDITTP